MRVLDRMICLDGHRCRLCYTEKAIKAGIAKNDNNNGTIKTTNTPTKPHPNSKRTTLQTCAPNIRRTTHISQHSTPINTQVTAHQRSIPQAAHAHPRPRQSAHNDTATILHTPVQARQALNHHDKASTQHRRHAEHSQKACIWYKRRRNKAPPPPPIQGGHRGRQKARREGTGGKGGRGGGGEGEARGKQGRALSKCAMS